MGRREIPVDLRNPGQVFACLGFLEAAHVLCGPAEGGFAWDDAERFILEAEGAEDPVAVVIEFLAKASAIAHAPFSSALRAKESGVATAVQCDHSYPCPEPETPSALPIILSDASGRSVRIEHWADGSKQRDTVKFWAGMGGYSGAALARDLLEPIASLSSTDLASMAADPCAFTVRQSSSFRFDLRGSYVPMGLGFSLNAHGKMSVSVFPVVELLAAVGLQNARPRMLDKLQYLYSIVAAVLPVPLVRAALGTGGCGFPARTFRVQLGWPGQEGQARCVLFAQEVKVDV